MIKTDKNDWIGKGALIELFKEKEREDIHIEEETIADMIREMKESSEQYHRENQLFYADMDKKIKEIQSTLNVTVSEQEKQRISQMSMAELLQEMMNNLDYIRDKVDELRKD